MTYLGEGGQIPYLNKQKIISCAEEVLEKYYGGREFPIDVEEICDELEISILPIPGLAKAKHIDAFISMDFTSIYVDSYEYEKDSNRYRFSVAHELGHFFLHRKYYPRNVKEMGKWIKISQNILNNYAEFQANYFAGSLLVPEEELVRVLDYEFDGSFVRNYWNASSVELGKILALVRKHFKVSDVVIARRMRDAFPGVGE
ncbi:ImmA/IrrE family metallo-endopeptidase [Candidatus Saccharibacteria bacterium]|nr:ImmA/IrrE family metallo-endopeptidase [Candidatus Saccharibacteria bacterium]